MTSLRKQERKKERGRKEGRKVSMMVYTCNPGTWEADTWEITSSRPAWASWWELATRQKTTCSWWYRQRIVTHRCWHYMEWVSYCGKFLKRKTLVRHGGNKHIILALRRLRQKNQFEVSLGNLQRCHLHINREINYQTNHQKSTKT